MFSRPQTSPNRARPRSIDNLGACYEFWGFRDALHEPVHLRAPLIKAAFLESAALCIQVPWQGFNPFAYSGALGGLRLQEPVRSTAFGTPDERIQLTSPLAPSQLSRLASAVVRKYTGDHVWLSLHITSDHHDLVDYAWKLKIEPDLFADEAFVRPPRVKPGDPGAPSQKKDLGIAAPSPQKALGLAAPSPRTELGIDSVLLGLLSDIAGPLQALSSLDRDLKQAIHTACLREAAQAAVPGL